MPLTMNTGQVAVFTQQPKVADAHSNDHRLGQDIGRRVRPAVSFRDGLVVVGSARAAYVFKQVDGVWREQQKIVSGL